MWKKSGFTIVEQAIVLVPEFKKIFLNFSYRFLYEGRVRALCKITSGALHCLWFIHCKQPPKAQKPAICQATSVLFSLKKQPKPPDNTCLLAAHGEG